MRTALLSRAAPLLLVLLLSIPALAEESRPKAPEFSLRTLAGERVKLSDYRGKVVLVNFWATWCSPCKQELPVLQKLMEKHADAGFTVLSVNIDDPKTAAEARRFVGDKKLTLTVALDPDAKVLGEFNPKQALPFLALVDREGRRAFQHTGFGEGAEASIEKEVLQLLAEKPAAVATP